MFDYAGVLGLLVLVAAFAWLTRRGWRIRRRGWRWAAIVGAGLLTVVGGSMLIAILVGFYNLNRRHGNPVAQLTVDVTPGRVARGERLAVLCAECHAADEQPPLEGKNFLGDDAPPVGTLYAPNLTPVHLAGWSDGEIVRAIREGVHREGRSLIIMPSEAFRKFSDEDLYSLVAYLRSQPEIAPDTPPTKLNVVGAFMSLMAPILTAQPPVSGPVIAPPEGPTAEYGAYLSSIVCAFCHGERLRGDAEFESPDITRLGPAYSQEAFIRLIRTGERPNGIPVDSARMPWPFLSRFYSEDDELRAIHAHLLSVSQQPAPAGER
jgi:cytochrome c553